MKTIYQALLKTGRIQGLIIYGSPYVFQWFREQIGQIPHLFTYGNQLQALLNQGMNANFAYI